MNPNMSATKDAKPLDLDNLKRAVTGSAAAFRCRRKLQPAGGEGDKVFPPTFAGAVYAVEQRRIPGRTDPVTCVVLDTVQSQANRMELALQEALDAGRIKIPVVKVDFSEWSPAGNKPREERLIDEVGAITSLQAPHRLADAILRDSDAEEEHDGEKVRVPFRQSGLGKALNTVSAMNATALYQLCPTALLLGMWDSTGPKGGLGAKFERAMVSEVVGVGAVVDGLLRGVRRDPLEIRAAVKVLKAADKTWSIAPENAKNAASPSEVNHSSVPFPKQREQKTDKNLYSGATIHYAEQLTTLSLIVLRRLRFPTNGNSSPEADAAGRTVLAALGLCAATLAFESGMGLRSRCLLWPDELMVWELLAKPGEPPQSSSLTSEDAIKLLEDAVSEAKTVGLAWNESPLVLKPSTGEGRKENLLELLRRSQLEATKEEAQQAS
jgi:CRISPR-associated protein Csb1